MTTAGAQGSVTVHIPPHSVLADVPVSLENSAAARGGCERIQGSGGSEQIALREFSARHIDTTFRWVGDARIRDGLLIDRNISWEQHLAWFSALPNDRSQRIFAVEADGLHVGNFGYRNISERHGSGELWMLIGPDYQGRHFGFPALQKGLAAGFTDMRLRKIYLHVDVGNSRAVALYARAGFRVEGVLAAEQLYRNRAVDLLRMSMLFCDHDGPKTSP